MNCSPEDKRILKFALNDLYFFTKHILNYKDLTRRVHKPLCDFIQGDGKIKLDLEPRDHFKTTCATIGNAIWRLCRNPNIRILINHKIITKAKEILREIKGHYEKNERFRYFFGDQVGEVWAAAEIVVKDRQFQHKEPSISIGAIDHEATSGHYEYIINDDLAGLKDMYSEAARENSKRYYQSLIYLRDTGNFLGEMNIGTRWHLMDIYSYQIKNKRMSVRIRQAIDEKGTPYFKERHTKETLQEMKDNDPILYESQMMNNPTAMSGVLYPLDKLSFYNEQSFEGNYQIAYIDPAFGKKETGEPCYLCFIIGTLIDNDLYIREWICNQLSPEQNELLICDKIEEFKISEITIESNAAQSEFIRNVENKLKERKLFINVNPLNNTANKDRRIQGMHGTVKNKVLFRKDWEECYPLAMGQLTLYPYAKFKDAPDALAGLVSTISEMAIPMMRRIGG